MTGCLLWAVLLVGAERDRPNVVVILADDLGYSDLGCYGGEIQTPVLDRLAAGGLRFTQFYNTSRCWPTRASLLTGYYAQQVRRDTVPGVTSGAMGRRPSWARLLPELLKPAGYRSYHAGKWHVDGMPIQVGFHHSYYLQDTGRFFSPRMHFADDEPLPAVTPGSGYYATTAIADRAIEMLRSHPSGEPFFLFVAFTAPHFPLHALHEDVDRYRERYDRGWEATRADRWARQQTMGLVTGTLSPPERSVGPPYPNKLAMARLGPDEVDHPVPWESLSVSQRRFQAVKMAIHAAMVDRMDREIGRIVEQLEAMTKLEETLIVFLSDNGSSAEITVRDDGHDPQSPPGSAGTHLSLGPGWSTCSNTPFRLHKTWVHEGGISTPMIVHWPRGIAGRGELRHEPAHVIDLTPTILELAGVTKPTEWDGRPIPASPGRSLVPTLARDGADRHDFLWWLHEGNRAIRVGDWKLVAVKKMPWELYDMKVDRTETTNLAEREPARARELEELWTRYADDFFSLARQDPASPDDNRPTGH